MASDDFAQLKQIFYAKPMGMVNKYNMPLDDLEVFIYTLCQKGKSIGYLMLIFDFYINLGTLKAAINYYRAAFRNQRDDLQVQVNVPVLIVWGCRDGALGEELADASQNYCSDVRLRKIPNASHWIQQDAPDEVNRYVEIFLNEKSTMKHASNY